MAIATASVYTVYPESWATERLDGLLFCLQVVRRNATVQGEAEEWSVSPVGRHDSGFTKTGSLVGLRGANRLNRRHAVFDLKTALRLAECLVEGEIESKDFICFSRFYAPISP